MNLSTYFNLTARQGQLEFVDVKLDDDNELFVNPQLIEASSSRLYMPMRRLMETYSAHLFHAITSSNNRVATYLLSGVREPKETRLGYGVNNPAGRSAGSKVKGELIDAIWNNQVIQTKSINKVSDLILFIPNFSIDRISDVTTKVLKHYLIEFTQRQCIMLGIPMVSVKQKDILNPVTLKWEVKDVDLPVYINGSDQKPIIFVPKDIVHRHSDGSSDIGYFFRFALNYVKDNDIAMFDHVAGSGKDNVVLVKDIKASIDNTKEELSKWILAHPEIMDKYWEVSLDRIKPLSDLEIEQIVYRDRNSRAA